MVFFSLRNSFSDNTSVRIFFLLFCKARIFFPEFNIRLCDKYSESDYCFFPPPKSEYFFSNIGNQNIFLEKNHSPSPPPLEVKCSVPNILSDGFGITFRIWIRIDLKTVIFPINVQSNQHQALSILLIL